MLPEELKNHIKQCYDFGSSAAGRVIHFTLLGMEKRGEIEKHEGKLRIKNSANPAVLKSAWERPISEQKN